MSMHTAEQEEMSRLSVGQDTRNHKYYFIMTISTDVETGRTLVFLRMCSHFMTNLSNSCFIEKMFSQLPFIFSF